MLFAGTSFSRGANAGGGVGGSGDGDDGDDRRDGRTNYPHDKVSAIDAVDLDSSDEESEAAGPGEGGGTGDRPSGASPLHPNTPPGHAPGFRVTVEPEGCSPPVLYTQAP